jgi:hypothetical protein
MQDKLGALELFERVARIINREPMDHRRRVAVSPEGAAYGLAIADFGDRSAPVRADPPGDTAPRLPPGNPGSRERVNNPVPDWDGAEGRSRAATAGRWLPVQSSKTLKEGENLPSRALSPTRYGGEVL